MNQSVIKHTKVNSTAKIIVSGPVECSTNDTLIFCDQAFEAGTDCFASAFGEKYFSDDQIIRHWICFQTNINQLWFMNSHSYLAMIQSR